MASSQIPFSTTKSQLNTNSLRVQQGLVHGYSRQQGRAIGPRAVERTDSASMRCSAHMHRVHTRRRPGSTLGRITRTRNVPLPYSLLSTPPLTNNPLSWHNKGVHIRVEIASEGVSALAKHRRLEGTYRCIDSESSLKPRGSTCAGEESDLTMDKFRVSCIPRPLHYVIGPCHLTSITQGTSCGEGGEVG